MNKILCSQLAIDYCCSEEDILDEKNHFSIHRFLDGRRRYREGTDCFLKITAFNGKLLFTGHEDILAWCEEQYKTTGSAWFFEAINMKKLNGRLSESGYQIEKIHPFFISETMSDVRTGDFEIHWYGEKEIEAFRGDSRFPEAYTFCPEAPDVIGVGALQNGAILGMAGASSDSPSMWQIGINVEPCARRLGLGTMLVSLLKNEILRRGILPYYGTAMSHIASLRVAVGSGFVPAWAELVTERIIHF